MEIKRIVGESKEVNEDDLRKMPYLKAIVLEGLRRHPPTHLGLPHAVTEDVILDGFYASIYFSVADIGLDSEVWEDPMAFKPERRICPGMNLAMLIMEYMLANLIWRYEWKTMDGDEVNMEEKLHVMLVMKNPLQVNKYPRSK
ncbi:hypothetical protein Pint_20912 [Pistacia integerrima]|uniref:Uncharacterized protein n=1 Tax=Pistacia integerrima TaxID=434235 RepID=A0ACC0X7X1_9ROSI|nr:hypothetical protein Pint_20912 [Pistacia integerrima]